MKELVSTANSANAATKAMEGLLRKVIIEKIANSAKVVSEGYATLNANLRDWLAESALSTFHLPHRMSIQLVWCVASQRALLLGCVVAKAAPKCGVAARRDELAAPPEGGEARLRGRYRLRHRHMQQRLT